MCWRPLALTSCAIIAMGCSRDARVVGGPDETGSPTNLDGSAGDEDSDDGYAEAGGTRLDVSAFEDLPPIDTGGQRSCTVAEGDADGMIPCDVRAQPNSFSPDVQWSWGEDSNASAIPLVANLTDDNGDGAIDLCDTPDVIVGAWTSRLMGQRLHVFDGATGALHFMIDEYLGEGATPALGDIDGDGFLEIVGITIGDPRNFDDDYLTAWSHDGTRQWRQRVTESANTIALADLDNDGDVEIVAGPRVYDHQGRLVFESGLPNGSLLRTPAAADLDGDGDLEVIYGYAAFHHDGSLLFQSDDVRIGEPGMSQTGGALQAIADFDSDGEPELLVGGGSQTHGFSMLEHDGTTKYKWLEPNLPPPMGDDSSTKNRYYRPAAAHDFDGDGTAEYAVGHGLYYTVFNGDASVMWSAEVSDGSGMASGTAFDFLGDGRAEAVFGDEHNLLVFDELGDELLNVPRTSYTAIEYPVVADVDNDSSAEIVVVTNLAPINGTPIPAVQVIRDVEDRWIPARRIWNQHTYHVTNIREDGTIPQMETPHWKGLNTFRTQAQISLNGVCQPPLPG